MHRSFPVRAALAALAVVLTACGSSAASPPTPVGWSGALLVKPVPKPVFTLTDTSGRPYDFRKETQGRVTLLYFGYTHCPDVCPLDMATAANALKKLTPEERAKVTVVFVTTDPARDTPAVLRAWLDRYSTSFVGLTGPPAEIAQAQVSAGVQPGTLESPDASGNYGVDHAGFVLAYGTDNLAHDSFPGGVTDDSEAHDLRLLLQGLTP